MINLYQVHVADPETPREETLRALDHLVRQGKVRALGEAATFATMEANNSILVRDAEKEIIQ